MRRPLVPALLLQCLVILILVKGFGLKLYHTGFAPYYDSVQTITGTVVSVQPKQGYTALSVDVGSEKLLIRLRGADSDEAFDLVGRKISATGKISEPDAPRNPGAFDYRSYLCARNSHAIMSVSRFKFSKGKIVNYPLHFLSVRKGQFFSAAKELMSPDAFALTACILFGDKGYLDEDLYEEFRMNGIAHLLAVSGLHVGLVYSAVRKLLRRRDKLSTAVCLACLFIYAALSGFSVSVIRAALMAAIHMLAFHIARRYDMLSSACAVAIFLLIRSPYYLFDSGAQLSFLAAYSLAVLLPYFDIKFRKLCDKKKSDTLYNIGSIFLPGLVLQLGMTPLTAFHFMSFSPLSVLINPVAIYLASLLLPSGLLCFAVFPIPLLLAAGCKFAEAVSFLLTGLSALSGKLCGGMIIPAPPLGLIALYYTLLFFFFSETRHILLRQRKDRLVVLLYSALVAGSCLLPVGCRLQQSLLPCKYDSYDAVFLDVGQGDGAHIQSRDVNILIDGGGSRYKDIAKDTLLPYLLKHGISRIDLAIVTHLDLDHSKGIADLSKLIKIDTIVFPISAEGEDISEFKSGSTMFVQAGDVIQAAGARFTVLSASGDDPNSGSIISLCELDGYKILFMADAPAEKELELEFCDVDLLKVGHHGSYGSTSRKLIEEAKPELAVISCGRNNNYGHPSDRVLELLANSSIIIKRTDLEGAICLKHRNIHTRY